MEFRLLGPLEVLDRGQPVPIDAPKQRAVLALLLLHQGETVSVDRLVEALWSNDSPATAAKAVRVYVGQVRKALGEGVILTQGAGYLLELAGHSLDVTEFEQLAIDSTRLLEAGRPD